MAHGIRRRRRYPLPATRLAAIGLVASLLLAGSPAQAAPPESDRADQGAAVEQQVRDEVSADGSTDFWVYLRTQPDLADAARITDPATQGKFVYERLTQTARTSQAGLVRLLDRAGADYQTYWIANTVRVSGDADLLDQIAHLPEVTQITADREYPLMEPAPAAALPAVDAVEWNIDRVNAPQVWDQFGVTGEGMVVGTIDSGVQHTHPALVEQYRGNLGNGEFAHDHHWFDPTGICELFSQLVCDNSGHGTHVTGTMVGDDGGENRIGVAPGAQWIAAKGCEFRTCSQEAVLASGQFMLAPTDMEGNNPDPDLRPHVVNNSWGGDASTDPWFRPTVQAWVAAGIFPMFANGNTDGAAPCGSASNPGNLPESYAAGAFDANGRVAAFSNRGPSVWGSHIIKPDIAAPGVNVRSAVPDDRYATNDGTSMASPHVAGAVALLWSAAPDVARNIDATRQLLDQTAVPVEDTSCGGTADHNNVWGHGMLDVYAAVEASPHAPVGTLTGVVAEADSEQPIEGATVAISGPLDRERTTAADGSYTINLPAGEYQLVVTRFGYQPRSAQVVVTDGEVTVQDFGLPQLDQVTVSGQVTDGSGHGWPLYAEVRVPGTPVATYTDPLTGAYQLSLPAGDTYQLEIEAHYPGYTPVTELVEVGSDDLVRDAALVVELSGCSAAPGYQLRQPTIALVAALPGSTRFQEYFDALGVEFDIVPAVSIDQITGYDVVLWGYNLVTVDQARFLSLLDRTDAEGTGMVFLDHVSQSWSGIRTLSRHTGSPASVGSSITGSGDNFYQVTQEHPILDGFEVGQRIAHEPGLLPSLAWFDGYDGEGREVIADAGRDGDGVHGSGIGVQQRDNNRHALLSMHSSQSNRGPANWSDASEQIFWNAIDWVNPDATALECVPVDGGLVAGNVTDLNTGAGVDPATVVRTADPSEGGESAIVAGDPQAGDGFYWLFSTATGGHEFAASASHYTTDTRTVDVVASSVSEADFALPAGLIEATPPEVEAELQMGESATRTVTLTNTGTAPATVHLNQRRGDIEILGAGGAGPGTGLDALGPGAEVRRVEIPGGASYAADPDGGDPAGGDPAGGVADAQSQDAWQELARLPRGVMDNTAALVDDTVYSFGGTDGGAVPDVYAFDVPEGTWRQLDDAPVAFQQSAHGVIDGLVYLVGGFGFDETVRVYDPQTGNWSTGAPVPAPRAAAGSAVLDGELYVVGGCTTVACPPFSTDAFRYDPVADRWETLPPYPEPVAFPSCGGVGGTVVCTGGVNGIGGLASTYAFDPAIGQWQRRASLPVDLWGSAHNDANDMLLVSGGAALNSSVTTNEGYAYDPYTDSWQALPASIFSLYRAGSSCGFYRAGGSASGFNAVPIVEFLPGLADCGDLDLPWLALDPSTATIEPGQSLPVTVTMTTGEYGGSPPGRPASPGSGPPPADGTTTVDQPGTYHAGAAIRHDTPYQVDPVAITMQVSPPPDWGRLAGQVVGVSCDGTTAPLPGATVQVNGKDYQAVLTTGEDGRYLRWLPHEPRATVIATAAGYAAQTRTVQIRRGAVTTEDWVLQAHC